ncbi:helix-turn-helix domain-containing protein [Amycolatopsis sp. NPDC058986]|uniref:helix-turn-helix domain-containing protein n=1 Tax=unclassified Amycolatopsis TaxID=2618356 RepID=UPI00366ECA3F
MTSVAEETSGEFPLALRAAITASGLSLDRIQYRLRMRGISISVPTLSHWQSGRRRPERPESLRALVELEQVLAVPPRSLRSLLGPPRPRGRYARPAPSFPADGLIPLSVQDRAEVGALGGLEAVFVRQVLRAERNGPDRWPLHWDIDPGHVPNVVASRHCATGRIGVDRREGVLSAELLFDSPLRHGETIIMDYRIVYPPRRSRLSGDGFARRFPVTTKNYLLDLSFAPTRTPLRCVRSQSPSGENVTQFAELVPNATGSAHHVAFDVTGRIGVRWEW